MMIMTRSEATPMILTSLLAPSMIFKPKLDRSLLSESQNPMVFMEAATAFAKAKMTPTEAPNSGPRDLEIMQ